MATEVGHREGPRGWLCPWTKGPGARERGWPPGSGKGKTQVLPEGLQKGVKPADPFFLPSEAGVAFLSSPNW